MTKLLSNSSTPCHFLRHHQCLEEERPAAFFHTTLSNSVQRLRDDITIRSLILNSKKQGFESILVSNNALYFMNYNINDIYDIFICINKKIIVAKYLIPA